jgi:Domain of unknown function (DUF4203)
MLAIIQLITGAIQLLLGRKIFWLMVGIMGFLLGLFLTVSLLDWPVWLKLLAGLGVGVVFSVLAVFIQKPMAAIFGFFAFGLASATLANLWGVDNYSSIFWIVFFVGGLVGVILVFALFDWALIIGTSLSGAGTVVVALETMLRLPRNGMLPVLLFIIMLAIGIIYQSKYLSPGTNRA